MNTLLQLAPLLLAGGVNVADMIKDPNDGKGRKIAGGIGAGLMGIPGAVAGAGMGAMLGHPIAGAIGGGLGAAIGGGVYGGALGSVYDFLKNGIDKKSNSKTIDVSQRTIIPSDELDFIKSVQANPNPSPEDVYRYNSLMEYYSR